MKAYLEEYINDDAFKYLCDNFELTRNINEANIIITRNLIVNKALMDKAPSLKAIAIYGTGVDAVDIIEAKKRGIVVFNAPKQNCLSVAELNVALMLAISRKLENAFYDTKHRGVIDYSGLLGNEITGKTVGFIGYGLISELTAKMLVNGFNMTSVFYNRSTKKSEYSIQYDLDYVLENSDYLVMGLALCDDTRYFLDYDKLSKTKKRPFLINATRGALVNHDDLVKALKNNIIRGYASDVFEHEPVDTNDELFNYNVIATPHIGGNSDESLKRVGMLLVDEMIAFRDNKEIKHLI